MRLKRAHAAAPQNVLHGPDSNRQPLVREADTLTRRLNPAGTGASASLKVSGSEVYSLRSLGRLSRT